ncbi:CCA tRNA nucleotidyltransferase [Mesorhizobium sp. J428]|uniref:CCA tRNA nucleotidyltransferase n=1 Tax=Mesorhizobium sp. J428 TaxID=2898440 RepID=UPI002151FBA8|nr:CCA tRNA nucleotidyltransferase [Mesorhizobium sp. J428]MCR5855588.1 CCA tRNA nucleotidyltransferase [Mesorhizobium sp. J428]
MSGASVASAAWLAEPSLQKLLAVLSEGGEQARVVGGAVRNTLLGEAVTDIDIATTTLPDETVRRAQAAGFRTFATGIEHGTVTVLADGRPHEVTTLRADIATDGRHATVSYGRDWKADAERRDFTVNALYAEADGTVIDLVGGLADLETRTIRFIGDAETRIREDYLRILRFFRFFAQYGGGRPDAAGLKACARLKEGMTRLSVERIWAELKKLLGAADPSRALLWMRQAGVLSLAIPESEKWGIDAIHGLVAAERDLGWPPDPLLRLEAIVPPDAARAVELAERLKLSNGERDRLVAWASAPLPAHDMAEAVFARLLYGGDLQAYRDRLMLALASARAYAGTSDKHMIEAGGYGRLLKFAAAWKRPVFPIAGKDLQALGIAPGPAMGDLLRRLEADWTASSFKLTREELLSRITAPGAPG